MRSRDGCWFAVALLVLAGTALLPAAEAVAVGPAAEATAVRVSALVAQARGGALPAAAQLLDWGLLEELGTVDPGQAAVAAWSAPQEVGPYTSQQLYGVVLAQWALGNAPRLRRWWQPTQLRARAFLIGRYSEQPQLLLMAAENCGTVEPRDRERARELFVQALLMQPDPSSDALTQAALVRREAAVAVACGYAEQDDLVAQMVRLTSSLHDPFWSERSARVQAAAAGSAAAGAGNPACRLAAQAAACGLQAHDPFGQAQSLMAQAARELLDAQDDAARDRAAALAGTAAAVFASIPLPGRAAAALSQQAGWLRPDRRSGGGSWATASALEVAAAAQCAADGDGLGQADALAEAARSASQNDPAHSTMGARELLREAVHLYRAQHADEQADDLLRWFDPSLDPK